MAAIQAQIQALLAEQEQEEKQRDLTWDLVIAQGCGQTLGLGLMD